jgi:methylenetetrahydrofolate reductase (NADPH)
MALGGDPPQRGGEDCPSDFSFASELVELIHGFAARSVPDSEGITVGVAGFPEGHPATPNRVDELDFLKRKVDAGADYICTQLFFDNRDFYDFRERCALAGIEIPILAGIMPLTTLANYQRLPSLALGARYPAALIRRMMECGSDEDVFKIGLEWSVSQCRDLLAQGVDGLHFYTLNQYVAVKRLWEELR